MQEQPVPVKKSESKTSALKKKNTLKKVDSESAKLLATLKERANKKSFGRKIKDGEIIAKGLSLIEPHHLLEIQETTFSEKDRLHMAHEEFIKQHGKISLDQFIGKLLKGQIRESSGGMTQGST